jgi:hypothetical protein
VQVQLDAKKVSLQVGNQGVDVRITDNRGRQVGTLRIGHATVEWRKGKIRPSTGRKLELSKFISEHLDVLGAAKPSAGRTAAAERKRPVRPAKPSTGRATAVRRKRPGAATCWPRGHHAAQAAGDPGQAVDGSGDRHRTAAWFAQPERHEQDATLTTAATSWSLPGQVAERATTP